MAQTLTPHLVVDDPAGALDFYVRAFGAVETMRLAMGDGIGHAEMTIGGARLMLAGEWPRWGNLGPKARGGPTTSFSLTVPDADAAYARAIEAGATSRRPPKNEFYGDRVGMVTDPFGHNWSLHTHIEDVPADEMQARLDAAMAQTGAA